MPATSAHPEQPEQPSRLRPQPSRLRLGLGIRERGQCRSRAHQYPNSSRIRRDSANPCRASANSPSRRASPARCRQVKESRSGSAWATAPAWARRYAARAACGDCARFSASSPRRKSSSARPGAPGAISAAARPSAARASSARSRTPSSVAAYASCPRSQAAAPRSSSLWATASAVRSASSASAQPCSVYRHRSTRSEALCSAGPAVPGWSSAAASTQQARERSRHTAVWSGSSPAFVPEPDMAVCATLPSRARH